MLLSNKNAVIYGAAGAIGTGIATTFAAHGAHVFLAGRTPDTLTRLAEQITTAGGHADIAELDALDETAVDQHTREIAQHAGSLDISLNLIRRGDVQGRPTTELTVDDFLRPVINGLTSTFLTARAAARIMSTQGSGVILALNSGSAHGSTMMGGTGPADAATDTFIRNLAAEVGPSGVRVLGLWAAGIPDTLTPASLAAVNSDLHLDDDAMRGLLAQLAAMRMLRRSPSLADIANTALFLASDHAAGITADFINVTGGMFPS